MPADKKTKKNTLVTKLELDDGVVLGKIQTLKDGSCFFHAVLNAVCNKYSELDNDQKAKFVSDIRRQLADSTSMYNWEKLNGGIVSMVLFQENIRNTIDGFYSLILTQTAPNNVNSIKSIFKDLIYDDKTLEIYTRVIKTINLEKVIELLVMAYNKTNSIDKAIEYFKSYISDYILLTLKEDNRLEKYGLKLFGAISVFSKNQAYELFITTLQDPTKSIDTSMMSLMSDMFRRNIYFIDNSTKEKYGYSVVSAKYKKCIVLLWIDNNHFETVFQIDTTGVKTLEFTTNSTLIKQLS